MVENHENGDERISMEESPEYGKYKTSGMYYWREKLGLITTTATSLIVYTTCC